MSTFNFSLKNTINGINNPTTDGVFSYGKMAGSTFTLFDTYSYIGPIIGTSQLLVWNLGGNLYPHLGFENLQGNAHVEPQPFPTFGVYMHPGLDGAAVRMTVPFNLDVTLTGQIQRASTNSGNNNIRFDIVKNSTILSSQYIAASDGIVSISQPTNSLVAGDTLDFVVKYGNDNTDSDDTALELNLALSYNQIPTPAITTSVGCNTTVINGEALFVAAGTIANLYHNGTLLQSTVLTTLGYNGIFSFTGLNLTALGGQNLTVVLTKPGDIDSLPVTIPVANTGCLSVIALNDNFSTTSNSSINFNISLNDSPC